VAVVGAIILNLQGETRSPNLAPSDNPSREFSPFTLDIEE
jgi:hypothetical protein